VAGGHIKADLDVMNTISKKFGTNFEALNQAITQLQNETETHAASWDGATKAAFTTMMTDVNTAWSKLNALLDETAANINTSAANYNAADTDGAHQVRTVDTTGITSSLVR
jgi:WXG100 family type VII secretion target